MIYIIWFLIILLVGICIASFFDKSEEAKNIEKINTEFRFSSKLDKLLKKVTQDEQILYKKIFDTITYMYPDKYEVHTTKDTLGNENTSVKIKNITIFIEKTLKSNGFYVDGTSYGRKVAKYECTGITIVNSITNKEIELSPPKEQFPIYDLIANYVIYKLECYYEDLRRDEEKKVSEEHQATVNNALKALK